MDADAQLPFVTHTGCSLRNYCFGAVPETVWADSRALTAFDQLSAMSDFSVSLLGAFSMRRSFRHALGSAFDICADPGSKSAADLKKLAFSRCGFDSIAPSYSSGNRFILQYNLCPPLLKRGSVGTSVCLLQSLLRKYGYAPRISGCFTDATERSLRALQIAVGLRSTGYILKGQLLSLYQLTRTAGDATMDVIDQLGG